MKQGEAARTNLDLDDLERQLSAAAGARRSGSDDPLAELARIVGYNDPAGARAPSRTAGSFDDFLVNPPRSVSDMMGSPAARGPAPATDSPPPVAPAPAPPPIPARELSPLSLQDELAAALGEPAPRLRPTLSIDESPSFDRQQSAAAPADPHQAEPIEAAPPPPAPQSPPADPRFDEMLKEFDAAMRDVGATPLQPPAPPQFEPDAVAAPTISPSLAYDAESEAATAPAPAPAGRSRFGMALAGGVIGVALIGAAGLLAFGGGSKTAPGAAPVIAAKPGVTKERPANPGGVEVPNQDKEILSRAPTAPQAERVAPREEQPVDLTQAQRTAAPPANGGAVRQIPGVVVLGSSSSQPPAAAQNPAAADVSAATSSAAQPRPVASVPITIAGQPPAAAAPVQPVAPVRPVAALPTTTAPTAPAAPAMTAPTAPAAPATQAVTPPAAPAAPIAATPGASASPNASTEPRRVRAVPIRPDEGAPNRAQAQPRVVPTPPLRPATPAAAATAEADDADGPLRITPQANRSTSPRSAAITPAAVPGSTGVPTTTQSTRAEAAPSGGGSFAVQIAAEGSQDAAQAKFNRMRAQHSGVLGGVSPSIRSAEVNGRAVYRVRVGQMSRDEAVSLCERLKADGGNCFVARN